MSEAGSGQAERTHKLILEVVDRCDPHSDGERVCLYGNFERFLREATESSQRTAWEQGRDVFKAEAIARLKEGAVHGWAEGAAEMLEILVVEYPVPSASPPQRCPQCNSAFPQERLETTDQIGNHPDPQFYLCPNEWHSLETASRCRHGVNYPHECKDCIFAEGYCQLASHIGLHTQTDECMNWWEVAVPSASPTKEPLLNLLSVIHRDGGHYTAEHGIEKSSSDAEAIVVKLLSRADAGATEQGNTRLVPAECRFNSDSATNSGEQSTAGPALNEEPTAQLRSDIGSLLAMLAGVQAKLPRAIGERDLEVIELIRKRWMAAGGEPK